MGAILLLHGMGMSSWSWAPVVAALRAGSRTGALDVRALDLPGHGARSGEAPLDDIDDMADDVAAQLGGEGGERVVVVGHSMGGAVAQSFLHRHGERVSRAVFVSSAVRFPAAPMMLEAARADIASLRAMFKDALGAADVVPQSRALFDQCSDEALRADIAACAGFDARAWEGAPLSLSLSLSLSRADAHVVVVGGTHDEVTPPKAWRRLAELWTARVVEVAAHGHMLTEECPALVADAILG